MECEVCGDIAIYMGTLGVLDWFRCLSCGYEQYQHSDDYDEEYDKEIDIS